MGDIGQRIDLLRLSERPARPIGKARRFVHLLFDDFAHQSLVSHLLAKAADHRGYLRIKKGRGKNFSVIPENFEILTGRMEHFHNRGVTKQAVQRLK